MSRWLDRVHRALRLDSELFEEVEHDHSAGSQALLTVLAASACGGLGNLGAAWILGLRPSPWPSLIVMVAGFVVTWLVWSFVTMAIGTSVFGGRADMGEMQRSLGFAAAPGLLMLIPGLGVLIGVPWSLMAPGLRCGRAPHRRRPGRRERRTPRRPCRSPRRTARSPSSSLRPR